MGRSRYAVWPTSCKMVYPCTEFLILKAEECHSRGSNKIMRPQSKNGHHSCSEAHKSRSPPFQVIHVMRIPIQVKKRVGVTAKTSSRLKAKPIVLQIKLIPRLSSRIVAHATKPTPEVAAATATLQHTLKLPIAITPGAIASALGKFAMLLSWAQPALKPARKELQRATLTANKAKVVRPD